MLLRTILLTTDVNLVGNYVVSETVAGSAQPVYVIGCRADRYDTVYTVRLRKIFPRIVSFGQISVYVATRPFKLTAPPFLLVSTGDEKDETFSTYEHNTLSGSPPVRSVLL